MSVVSEQDGERVGNEDKACMGSGDGTTAEKKCGWCDDNRVGGRVFCVVSFFGLCCCCVTAGFHALGWV